MSDYPVFDTLCDLLNTSGARFRVLAHPAEGKSDAIAALRTRQGAKAMLCTFKDGGDTTALAVIPGHLKIDFRKVADAVGRRKATLASPDLAATVTRCVMGAVPPFVFDARVTLVVDPAWSNATPRSLSTRAASTAPSCSTRPTTCGSRSRCSPTSRGRKPRKASNTPVAPSPQPSPRSET